MRLHDEDFQLQIRLAELQADVQTRLTLFFSFLAISVSILLALQQFYLSGQQVVDPSYILMSMIGSMVVFSFVLIQLFHKALVVRRRIGELRKHFILRGKMPPYLEPEKDR